MKYEELIKEIEKLENYYDKNLSDQEKEIWFDNLKSLPIARIQYIFANLYKTCKYMPKLSEVWDAHKDLAYLPQTIEKKVEKANCEICGNSGYCLVDKIINGTSYQFVKVCRCGREQVYDGSKLTDESKRNNYRIDLVEPNYKPKYLQAKREDLKRSIEILKNWGICSERVLNSARILYRKLEE